ncbi:MAG: type I-F CRISPR-associated protein Csy1 [Sulfuricurvum sp.]|nr:type I-F CRISPR-associated protein Csy1 [Sulfuricurvum sp.]
MIDKAISQFIDEQEEPFSFDEWLIDSAKKAGQMSISTHPCTFSHPSARKNKNGYVTPIIADVIGRNDGLLRSGNVIVQRDALGNAAAIKIYKFLHLVMEGGQNLMNHIKEDSKLAKKLLAGRDEDYTTLRNGFLAMLDGETKEVITSSKIKQVYFPVDDDYHQLSILSNSGLIYHLKKRIDTIRFSDEAKELREKKRKNMPSDEGFCELYDLTAIGYGGTKPQNISVLNNQNGGKAYLLRSMPPVIEKRSIRFPKRDFFRESIRPYDVKDTFHALHTIFKTDYNNVNIRDGKHYRYQQLIDRVIEKMWDVRSVAESQYFEGTSQLAGYQRIWLLDSFVKQRESEDNWLDELCDEIARWILDGCEKGLKKSQLFGPTELQDIRNIVEANKEVLR